MAPRRRCPVCGSKQWRKEPSSGLVTCSEGHVLQNYRNETREVTELGPHAMRKRTLKSGRKKKERQSRADPKLYHGERARYHYHQCLQLILRMQISALSKAWDLPPEFEVMCRDIWALHLALLPNPPSAEPYLYLQEQHGFGQNKKSSAPGEEGSDGKRDGEESSDEDNQAPEEENDDNEDEDGKSGSSSSDDDSEDPELAKLLRENSESPSSSDNDEQPRSQPADTERKGKGRFIHQEYDSPAGNISILMIACWTMRFPVMYMDFVRLIEAYELPYLDSLRLLPPSLTLHLTKQNIQALSPHFAPTPMHMHRLTSRLAKLMFRSYSILTPECNAAPLLWRAVRGLQGNPTLYTLTKQLAHTLSLTLTLHYSLAPKLKKLKTRDPEHHKYDNAPPEVSLAATVIVVLKLVYGLDGRKRTPKDIHDPACALPNLSEYLIAIKELEERERKSRTSILSASSTSSALDMDNDMLDDYLDFCEKALLPRENRNIEHGVIRDYFPLTRHLSTPDEGVRSEVFEDSLPDAMSAVRIHENSSNLGPGNAYAIYHTQDVLGSLPEDYEKIVNRAATWAGVEEDYVCGVVERFERRLARWWDKVRRREKAETLGRVDEDDE